MNFFSDDFIDQNNARIFSLYEIQPRYVSQDQKQEEKCREESFADKVSDEMKSFLMSVYPNQYIPEMTLTNVCKYAGFPGGTGSRIVKKCLRMNLIKIIAMTSVHEKENIEKDINLARADYLIVACINQKVFKEVQDIIKEMPEYLKNKTEVYLISELLKINPDEFIKNHQLNIHL